jgi:hypothetical protein
MRIPQLKLQYLTESYFFLYDYVVVLRSTFHMQLGHLLTLTGH